MRVLGRLHVKLVLFASLLTFTFCVVFQDVIFCQGCDQKRYAFATKSPPSTLWPSSSQWPPSGKSVTKSLAEIARVPGLSDHILMFNRIPWSGSEIFVLLLQKLQGVTFKHVRLDSGNLRQMTRKEQKRFTEDIAETMRQHAIPLSFDKIVYFTNFTELGIQSPMYFSVIRNPYDNIISRMGENFTNCQFKNYEECFETSQVQYGFVVPYFCGHSVECSIVNNRFALNRAKDNVDRYYPVVGILDHLSETFIALENKLPLFFKGAEDEYIKRLAGRHKEKILDSAMKVKYYDRIKSYLLAEYEFYNWARMRLFKQIQTIMSENVVSTTKHRNIFQTE